MDQTNNIKLLKNEKKIRISLQSTVFFGKFRVIVSSQTKSAVENFGSGQQQPWEKVVLWSRTIGVLENKYCCAKVLKSSWVRQKEAVFKLYCLNLGSRIFLRGWTFWSWSVSTSLKFVKKIRLFAWTKNWRLIVYQNCNKTWKKILRSTTCRRE